MKRTSAAFAGCAGAMLLLAAFAAGVHADPVEPGGDLGELSLDQLSRIEVTSVSRRSESLANAAASVYVITAEEIRRSGAKTLPELLRLAPTLQVARADANQYAVSARGFNSVLANKLLVLIDGRTVYSPLFSGVFWEAQDLLLADVERVEVISGPGGTAWGTNAVNGVINVISRSATETKGLLAAVAEGTDHRVAGARYGWGSGPHYRLYGKLTDQDHSELTDGRAVRDGSRRYQAGGHARWAGSASNLSLDAGLYENRIDQTPDVRDVSGYHLLAVWVSEPVRGPRTQLQAYYERTDRDQPGSIIEALDTYDLQLQNDFRWSRHTIVWGGGYRNQPDRVRNLAPAAFRLIPADEVLESSYVFAQDDLRLLDGLMLTAGARFERNRFTGWEALPTLRASWRVSQHHMLWGALSRAVRAPSRVDREFFSPGAPPHFVLDGGEEFTSEILESAEVGYRAQPLPAVSYSVTAFTGNYTDLRSIEPSPSGPTFRNGVDANVRGLESWTNLHVTAFWRVTAGGVVQSRHDRVKPGYLDLDHGASLGIDPNAWWSVRNAFDVGPNLEFDANYRHVEPLDRSHVPAYDTADARVGWRPGGGVEVSVTGSDLLGPSHSEWGAPGNRAVCERRVLAQVQWRL